ncbi:UNVERIFIED_CONTAM: hypothetical protein HDU68_007489 [Siphonaria sp. JEL0065]|nr:hypothetical protein HDU68_007489 [Siphonaria sp. JEL0065]
MVDLQSSDWSLTQLIYPEEAERGTPLSLADNGSTYYASAVFEINTRNIVLIRNSLGQSRIIKGPGHSVSLDIEPAFPCLCATFTYSTSDLHTITEVTVDDADSVTRTGSHFDIPWCNWINSKVEQLLLQDPFLPSSSILEFILNDSITFFESFAVDTPWGSFTCILASDMAFANACAARVALPHEFLLCQGFKTPLRSPPILSEEEQQQQLSPNKHRKLEKRYIPPPPDTRKTQIANHFRQHGYKMFQIECPFCYDTYSMDSAIRLFCGHIYCKECMDRFLEIIVREMGTKPEYPFMCPDSDCKSLINLAYDETLKRLLSPTQLERVLENFKCPPNPPATSIVSCPRASCSSTTMKQCSGTSLVYCDVCTTTWCERCLVRVKGEHKFTDCDSKFVGDLNARYRQLEEGSELKRTVDASHPWIGTYVRWFEVSKRSTHDKDVRFGGDDNLDGGAIKRGGAASSAFVLVSANQELYQNVQSSVSAGVHTSAATSKEEDNDCIFNDDDEEDDTPESDCE